MYVNVNGVLQKVSKVYANVSGSIKTIKTGYVNANGTLRKFIVNGVNLLGTGWQKVGSTGTTANTSTQLTFYNTKEATAEVWLGISIPAGAQIHLEGRVWLYPATQSGTWQIDVEGSTTRTLASGTIPSDPMGVTISGTFLVPEAATKLTLRATATGAGSGADLVYANGDFSKIQLLT